MIEPKTVRPWSNEMYDYNDYVADFMKMEIETQINNNKDDWDILNQLIDLCGEVKYGDGYTIEDLHEGCLKAVQNVQNYWLNDEWSYFVSKGLVNDVDLKFVGYGK